MIDPWTTQIKIKKTPKSYKHEFILGFHINRKRTIGRWRNCNTIKLLPFGVFFTKRDLFQRWKTEILCQQGLPILPMQPGFLGAHHQEWIQSMNSPCLLDPQGEGKTLRRASHPLQGFEVWNLVALLRLTDSWKKRTPWGGGLYPEMEALSPSILFRIRGLPLSLSTACVYLLSSVLVLPATLLSQQP